MTNDRGRLLGTMYVACRPCGKLTAAAWIEGANQKELGRSVAEWIVRGDTVKKIVRYANDPQLEWVCRDPADCACCLAG